MAIEIQCHESFDIDFERFAVHVDARLKRNWEDGFAAFTNQRIVICDFLFFIRDKAQPAEPEIHLRGTDNNIGLNAAHITRLT